MGYAEELQEIRIKLVDRTLFATSVFLLLALAASVSRFSEIGLHPIYFLHAGCSALMIILFLFRKHLSLAIKSHTFFGTFLLIAVAGLVPFKIASGSFFILMVVSLSAMIYGAKQGILYTLIFSLLYIAIAFLHISHKIGSSVDFNVYLDHKTTWLASFAGTLFTLIVLIYANTMFFGYLIGYIKSSARQKDELHNSLQRLKESEEKFRSVIESGNDGYLFANEDFIITYVNNSFLELSGYKKEELIGKHYEVLMERSDDWNEIFTSLASRYSEKKNAIELEMMHKSGGRVPVDVNVYRIDLENSIYRWAVVKDLTEKKQLENNIFDTMIRSEEKERERYARELHDGLGPLLTTSMIYVSTIARETDGEPAKQYADRAYDLLQDATKTIQEISNNLSPLILKEYGIAQAVRSFIEKIREATEIKFSIHDTLSVRFSETLESTIYRILVELVNNSLKYSQAGSIDISFACDDSTVSIRYRDDGKGFEYDKALDIKGGFGLRNLENRIKKLGGTYSYRTAPGEGVQVTILLKYECT